MHGFGLAGRRLLCRVAGRMLYVEFKVEAAHWVIDSGRPVAQVARELTVSELTLGR